MPDTFSRAFHHGAGCAEFHQGCKDLTSEMFALLADNKKQTGTVTSSTQRSRSTVEARAEGTVADTHDGFESRHNQQQTVHTRTQISNVDTEHPCWTGLVCSGLVKLGLGLAEVSLVSSKALFPTSVCVVV